MDYIGSIAKCKIVAHKLIASRGELQVVLLQVGHSLVVDYRMQLADELLWSFSFHSEDLPEMESATEDAIPVSSSTGPSYLLSERGPSRRKADL